MINYQNDIFKIIDENNIVASKAWETSSPSAVGAPPSVKLAIRYVERFNDYELYAVVNDVAIGRSGVLQLGREFKGEKKAFQIFNVIIGKVSKMKTDSGVEFYFIKDSETDVMMSRSPVHPIGCIISKDKKNDFPPRRHVFVATVVAAAIDSNHLKFK